MILYANICAHTKMKTKIKNSVRVSEPRLVIGLDPLCTASLILVSYWLNVCLTALQATIYQHERQQSYLLMMHPGGDDDVVWWW